MEAKNAAGTTLPPPVAVSSSSSYARHLPVPYRSYGPAHFIVQVANVRTSSSLRRSSVPTKNIYDEIHKDIVGWVCSILHVIPEKEPVIHTRVIAHIAIHIFHLLEKKIGVGWELCFSRDVENKYVTYSV